MAGERLLSAAGALGVGASGGKGSGTGLLLYVQSVDRTIPVELDMDATVGNLYEAVVAAHPAARGMKLQYREAVLADDKESLADLGVCQEVTLELVQGANAIGFSEQHKGDDWDAMGARARRTRKTQGWNGSCVLSDRAFEHGRHLMAVTLYIKSPGSTNFSVGCALESLDMNNQMYSQSHSWACIDHGDAYAKGTSHNPRKGYKAGVPMVVAFDMEQTRLSLWRQGEQGQDPFDNLVEFTNIEPGVHFAVCTLAHGPEDDYGADFIELPEWATSTDFIRKLGWGTQEGYQVYAPTTTQ
eukprot:Hpha_TRINITY_DN4873_c0_g1::TRINITY_DN4873_c0_g1_i1::g.20382::m.20382